MTFSHFCGKPSAQYDVLPSRISRKVDCNIWCKTVRIIESEKNLIWDIYRILFKTLELGDNDIFPLSQHFSIAFFFQ